MSRWFASRRPGPARVPDRFTAAVRASPSAVRPAAVRPACCAGAVRPAAYRAPSAPGPAAAGRRSAAAAGWAAGAPGETVSGLAKQRLSGSQR